MDGAKMAHKWNTTSMVQNGSMYKSCNMVSTRLCVDQVCGESLIVASSNKCPKSVITHHLLWEINITISTRDSCSKGINITLRWTVWNSLKFTTRQKIKALKGKHDTFTNDLKKLGSDSWAVILLQTPSAWGGISLCSIHGSHSIRPPLEVPGLEVQRPDRENWCWWTKSCSSWDGKYNIYICIYI